MYGYIEMVQKQCIENNTEKCLKNEVHVAVTTNHYIEKITLYAPIVMRGAGSAIA